jgi:2',3'-cyclic-nucleotide 2'-phosphodiesterase/3'-nucleotidase
MPGFFGSHLGVIDLILTRKGAGWRVSGHSAEARPIAERDASNGRAVALIDGDSAIEDTATPLHGALKAQGDQVVGRTVVPLHSYFALVKGSIALDLVALAQTAHLRSALAGTEAARLPIVSAVAPFKAGGRGGPENYTDIPVGPVTERHVSDLYLHPNRLVALRVRGRDLADWLERSVSLFHQITPGAQDAELVDPDFPSFNFDMIFGLTYQVDLSKPARYDARGQITDPKARRIVDLRYQASALDPQAEFVLATNSYRSSGGAGFPCCTPDHVLYSSPQTSTEILRNHIQHAGRIGAGPMAAHWGFKPMANTTALLQAAPAASRHLHEIAAFRPEPLDLLPDGYQRFRLHL